MRDAAIAELHALLVRGARHELARRKHTLTHLGAEDLRDLGTQAADDALVAILAKLDTFRGASRFTTWAYKFVLLEAGVKARRRAWQGREVTLDAADWPLVPDASQGAHEVLEELELLGAIRDAVETELTPHQREMFSALALNSVPIDVLAERLATTRGALYKTLHDARRTLRAALAEAGHSLSSSPARTPTCACPGCASTCRAARPATRITNPCAPSSHTDRSSTRRQDRVRPVRDRP